MPATPSLIEAVQALSRCRDYPAIAAVIRRHARGLVGADGVTFVLLKDGMCHYIEEDAISPLWKGQRFPADRCIGGWVAAHREPAVIEDVFADPRIPHGAYRPTFVKSLAVVPVRSGDPIGTLGAYWAAPHRATPGQLAALQALADSASVAWANAGLIADLRAARDAAEGRAAENARLLAELTDQFDLRVRAEADRDRLGEQLRQAQKMDALGRMAAGVAHDLNNVLAAVVGFADLLAERVAGDPDATGMAAEVAAAGDRGRGLTGQLLRFARRQPFTPEAVDLNRVVADAERLVGQVAGPRVRVRLAAGPGLPAVSADPVQIGQVLLNLAANARDAMPGGGVLGIGTSAGPVAGGPGVWLAVSDTGAGIPAAVRERLFEPFYTSKPAGQGTGLGLSIVADIVARHGGVIAVDSEAGRGTTFRIGLPVAGAVDASEGDGATAPAGRAWEPVPAEA